MIIWGWRAVKRKIGTGIFFCPRCGGDREYVHKSARRFFTLFFIPIIPLNDLGEFVECSTCKNTFYPDVLKGKTAAQIQDVSTIAIRHVVVAMLLADGTVDPREREAALMVVSRFATNPYGAAELDADLQNLQVANLTDNLEELGAILNEHGKENVLTSAVYLAGSDGHIDRSELDTARDIGKAMTMSGAHIEGTISQELSRLGLSL